MKLLGLVILTILLWSCSNTTVYEQDFDVDETAWHYNDTLSFNFEIENPNQNYNLLINLKYLKTYKYRNIFFFVDVIAPENQIYRDTIECIMASPTGKWLGKSSGDYIQHQFMYRYNVNFPEKGTYRINIQQAMRDSLLPKISKLGLELQKFVEPKK